MIAPGATLGILGDGQLGRMIATAAAELGYRTHVYGQRPDASSMQVATTQTIAAFDDTAALEQFAKACDVVTLEFENIPPATVRTVDAITRVSPGAALLEIAQHRGREKNACIAHGALTAPFALVSSAGALAEAVNRFGSDVVIKTCRFGYDGKGQVRVRPADAFNAEQTWTALLGDGAGKSFEDDNAPLIVEQAIAFSCEISAIAARSTTGEVRVFPCAQNQHRDGILRQSVVPAAISPAIAGRAQAIAHTLVTAFDVVGLLAVEFFVVGDPSDDSAQLLVNEVAPRPHNSGHWSQDGGATSQFAQLVRAVCGLPLGDPRALSPTTMHNLIGDDAADLAQYWANPLAAVHLYGKGAPRAGRKMGHVNVRHPAADAP